MRKLLMVVGIAGVLGGIGNAATAVMPETALADTCVGHPSDGPSTNRTAVCMRTGTASWVHLFDVCDRHADGHNAYARMVIYQGPTDYYVLTGYDTNGSAAGCSTYDSYGITAYAPPVFNDNVVRAIAGAVCVQAEGCSGYKDTFTNSVYARTPVAHWPGSYIGPNLIG